MKNLQAHSSAVGSATVRSARVSISQNALASACAALGKDMRHRCLQWLQRASVMGSTPEDNTSVAQWQSNELLIRQRGFESRQKLALKRHQCSTRRTQCARGATQRDSSQREVRCVHCQCRRRATARTSRARRSAVTLLSNDNENSAPQRPRPQHCVCHGFAVTVTQRVDDVCSWFDRLTTNGLSKNNN